MATADSVVVTTTCGPIRGRRHAYGDTFLGVPYAAPPVGERRFAPPICHDDWSEVPDATQPGPTAPQLTRAAFGNLDMSPYFGPGWRHGEDYLTLNIWAPETDGTRRPVMVFVHGFVAGSINAPLYDGSSFSRTASS